MIDIDIVEQLVPNPLTMLVQLCSTLVLFLLMKKFLWKSVQNFMQVRADKMQSDLQESEQAKQDAFSDREKALEQLSQASAKSEEIVKAATKEAKDEKAAILAQADKEATAIKQKAHEQIEAERVQMYDAMKKEMVDIAMEAASKLIGTQDVESLDKAAVDAFVKEADLS